jgi:hypothetical protein
MPTIEAEATTLLDYDYQAVLFEIYFVIINVSRGQTQL